MVENYTTRGMASPLHSHFKGNTIEIVYRLGIVKRNYILDDIPKKLYHHFFI
jgi:hypothetical protein